MSLKRGRTYAPRPPISSRRYGSRANPIVIAGAAPAPKRGRFARGRDRTGGYYGRFQPGGGELKFHDVDLDDDVIATGGVVTDSVCKIAQGTSEVQRIGRKCTLRSIYWKFRVDMPEIGPVASPNTSEQVRVILYLDKQCNGATATALGILETVGFHSFRNLANQSRFTILMDKTTTMNWRTLASDTAGAYRSAEVITEHTFFKRCNIPLEFDSTAGAITEIRSNNLGVLLISQVGTAGFISKFRLRFSDN